MRKKVLHIALVVVAVAMLGAAWVLTTPYLRLRRIEIYGLESLTEDEVLRRLPVVRGANLLFVSADDVVRALSADRRIDSVEVHKSYPDGLVIYVHEKKPMYLLNCGRLWGLSRDGVAIPLEDARKIPSLPIISPAGNYMPVPYHRVVDSSVVRSVAFMNHLADSVPEFFDRISEVFSPRPGEFDLVLAGSGIAVRMTDDTDALKRLRIILSNLDTDTISPYEIDLRFPGQGIVRFKPKKNNGRMVGNNMEMKNG